MITYRYTSTVITHTGAAVGAVPGPSDSRERDSMGSSVVAVMAPTLRAIAHEDSVVMLSKRAKIAGSSNRLLLVLEDMFLTS